MKISFSHYSRLEIKDAVLQWEVIANESAFHGGRVLVGECSPFGVTEVGTVSFETPQIREPGVARLLLKLVHGDEVIASTEQDIYVFPELPAPDTGELLFAPELGESLRKLGYSTTEDPAQADLAVVTVLDDSLREFILRGGRVLLLAESDEALQMYIPGLKIKEREETAWQGDWATSFGWHRFDKIPTGGVVNFAFAGLTPEHILLNFQSREFAFEVHAGMFLGWLHKPVATIARRQAGQGEVLVSTFRLSRNLETNSLARYLFAELMRLLQVPKASLV